MNRNGNETESFAGNFVASDEQTARAKFKTCGGAKFLSGSVEDWTRDPLTYEADLVLTNGVLHHVDDDAAKKILKFAYRALKDNGRFIFYEPCYLFWQSGISAYFMSLDRGQNIRTEQQWKELASSIFPVVSTNIVTGVNRLGYVCIVGQCRKSAIASTSSSYAIFKRPPQRCARIRVMDCQPRRGIRRISLSIWKK
jgi:SAM-dependent methyltransferase